MAKKKRPKLFFESKRFRMRPYQAVDYMTWRSAYESMFQKQNEFDEEPKSKDELSRAEFAKMLKKHKAWQKDESILFFGVFEKKTGRLMGYVLISLVLRFNVQTARIAYFVFNNYWKHGYGTEIVNAMVEFAFRKLKLHRLEAEVLPYNRASIALAEKIGMQYEGLRRKAVYFNRKWHDHIVYAIIAEDRGLMKTKPVIV